MNSIQTVLTDNLDIWTSALLTKSTAGRGSNSKLEAYGIKKLRELILELAVRGKLVPQDQNDEPTSVLLKKIVREKARLIKEGVIKNEKPLPSISKEEIPFDVPGGWIWQRLGELGFTQTGGTPSKTNKEYFGKNIPFIKPGDIYPDYVDYNNEGLSTEGAKILGRTAPAGSILMVCIGTIGKCNMIERTCAFNQQINSITPYMEVSSYILKVLGSVYFQKTAWERSSSTTIAILNKGKWVDIVVPLPPVAEQHRIVAKVDELMTLCDQLEQQQTHRIAAHQTLVETLLGTLTRVGSQQEFSAAWARIASHFDTLLTTEASIAQLKQTLLQLAVMGKLVPQDPSDEPIRKLLKRKEEMPEEGTSFRIPASWVWARVDEFAQTRLGKMLDKAKNKGAPVRYLRNINVRWFNFDLTDVKEMRFENSELDEFALRRGDVLVCEGGYPGRAAVWDEREANIYFQKAIHRVRLPNWVNSDYFVKVLRESADSGRLNSYFTGAGIQHFTGKGLSSFLVPLPPPAEQHRIVAKVDELMTLCDALKARLADAQAIQLHLADAIVEQAVC